MTNSGGLSAEHSHEHGLTGHLADALIMRACIFSG